MQATFDNQKGAAWRQLPSMKKCGGRYRILLGTITIYQPFMKTISLYCEKIVNFFFIFY